MSSRMNFLRTIIEAASRTDSTANANETADSVDKVTASQDGAAKASSASGHGRGRARLLSLFADPQQTHTSAEATELPRSNPASGGRGRFVQRILNLATEQVRNDDAVVSTVSDSLTKGSCKEEAVTPEQTSIASVLEKSPPKEPVVRTGKTGTGTTLLCNFMELKCDPDRGIFLYTVDFKPALDSKKERYQCVKNNLQVIGQTYTFDGTILLIPQVLPSDHMVVQSKRATDGSDVVMTLKFRGRRRLGENVMFYNKLFRRIMGTLQLSEIGRKNFDPTQARIVPQHKLEIWPGFVTAVNEYEGGLMLNLDITHRVLMQTTVYDHIKLIANATPAQYRENLLKSLLGTIVLTRYNNKTYRIDDVCFESTPLSTFRYGERDITYVEYYRQQYDIEIMDHRQPLLLNRVERRIANTNKPQEMIVCLVPEICHLTGLTDEMRSDFKVMRDIATYTRVSPNQRVAAMEQFCANVNSNEKARALLAAWGLELMSKAKTLVGRQLPNESIRFGKQGVTNAGPSGDFNNQLTNHHMLEVVHIRHWMLIHTRRDARVASAFIDVVNRSSGLVGINISQPQTVVLPQDSTQLYVQTLRTRIGPETQIVVIICPTSRDDRYAAIKRVCCTEIPIPTQVINANTLMNDKRTRSIVLKIILQMNCKLGGTLWGINIPLSDTMICGMDTYHECRQKSASVAAVVVSLDAGFTRWYSRATVQSCKEEFMNGLCASFVKSLQAYQRRNGTLPGRLIIFRDGVGDAQTVICEEYEIPQVRAACQLVQPGYDPKITFIVVQKRIFTRMFSINRSNGTYDNALPGTVLDHSVTRRYQYDFFLISQSVRQGTTTPAHYIVLQDDSAFAPDILQQLSYKMCYMYYNWPGTIRVPACCQYAHKLAYMVGETIKRTPAESLCDKLFYL